MEAQNYRHFKRWFKTVRNDFARLDRDDIGCDSRYRSIIGQLDTMIESNRREPAKDVGPHLDRLLDIMTEHIGNENAYMGMVGFPLAVQHSLNHQFICAKTAALRHSISKDREALPKELGYVRLLWLVHIQMYDRAFEEFLASRMGMTGSQP